MREMANGQRPWPLFLHGGAGRGKTCAALCMLDRSGGAYYSAGEMCDVVMQAIKGTLRGRQHGGKIAPDALWAEWARMNLFVLDELGSREKVGDFIYDTTKRLVDIRSGKPLIVISNLDLPTLAVLYDDRLTSRLAAGTVVHLLGEDRRMQR